MQTCFLLMEKKHHPLRIPALATWQHVMFWRIISCWTFPCLSAGVKWLTIARAEHAASPALTQRLNCSAQQEITITQNIWVKAQVYSKERHPLFFLTVSILCQILTNYTHDLLAVFDYPIHLLFSAVTYYFLRYLQTTLPQGEAFFTNKSK